MALTPGTRLGPYELVSAIGAGGMGEVYRARDTRLGREVAVKILPGELAHDPERRERFEREARIVAALNHPNILALYDIGSDEGITYLVTEIVEGDSLRNAQLTRRTALEVAAQIADGLGAAHAAGVTHRDLKPDNIMVTRDGRVKILDFGVAKVTGLADVAAATVASTGIGVIVGTAGYMAPEQIRGTAVDYRTDIFAFGIVLHEMLSGARPFGGDTAADVIGAILSKDPPELPADVPAVVRQVVQRCLEKKPEGRFQSAHDLAFALRQLSGSSIAAAAESAPVRARVWPRAAIVGGIAASVVVLGAALAVRWSTQTFDAAIDPIQLTRVSADRLRETGPAFSPDGRSIAYVRISGGANELLVRSQDALTPLELVRTSVAVTNPVWSPDSNRICYSSVNRDFMCVGAAGGMPQRVLSDAFRPKFTPDGRALVFVRAADGAPRLFRSEPPGAEPRRIGDVPRGTAALSSVSPDGSTILAYGASGRWLISVATGALRKLPDDGVATTSAAWFPDSRHLAVTELTTNPVGFRILIIDSGSRARRLIVRSADPIENVDVSRDGSRILYSSGAADFDVAEYSIAGKFVRAVAASANVEMFPSWAPRGDRLVYVAGGPGQSDVLWVAGTAEGTPSVVQKLAFPDLTSYRFSPDGRRIVYSDRTGLQIVATTGGQSIRALASSDLGPYACWSSDGEWVLYSARRRLNKLPSQGGEPVALPGPPFTLHDCSPDGRWLVGRGPKGFLVLSTDGTQQHDIATNADYPFSNDLAQFGEGGRVLYVLNQNRQAIEVLTVPGGARLRSIMFDVPAGDMIEGFSIDASSTRVLLTIAHDRQDLWMAEGFARPATSWRRWFRHWEAPS